MERNRYLHGPRTARLAVGLGACNHWDGSPTRFADRQLCSDWLSPLVGRSGSGVTWRKPEFDDE